VVELSAETRLCLQGASDHSVSDAVYLADPEGNGIEIYTDRPRSMWRVSNGLIEMLSDPLDLHSISQSAGATRWDGFPNGGVIGHAHLQVGAIASAEEFYSSVLGFDVTWRYSGGTFFGAGEYHRHLAANIWNSRGAGVRTYPSTGLADVEIITGNAVTFDALRTRVKLANVALKRQDYRLSIGDPWGTSFRSSVPRADVQGWIADAVTGAGRSPVAGSCRRLPRRSSQTLRGTRAWRSIRGQHRVIRKRGRHRPESSLEESRSRSKTNE
jgi:catechol 2,3-dioxygenase